jgi:hypothetical protein
MKLKLCAAIPPATIQEVSYADSYNPAVDNALVLVMNILNICNFKVAKYNNGLTSVHFTC